MFIMRKLTTILASALLVFGTAFAGEYGDISIQDLDAAIKAGKVTVIDVNGSDSYTGKGHIPGAIDFAVSQEKLASILPQDKNQLVVAYCSGPACPAYKKAADAASQLGYSNVKHLASGINGWLEAGMPVEKSAKKEGCAGCSSCPSSSKASSGACTKGDCDKKSDGMN